ncbi:MAG: RodZ domain-containing protein [Actinomycetes bacterium]
MSDEQRTIGQQLADARREAGLSVEEVSETTRLRGTVIRAIEADDFAPAGGDIYARGHIRAMAAAAGIDAAPLIATFDAERAPSAPTVTEVFEHETSGRIDRRGPNWSAVMAAALVTALVLVGVQIYRGGDTAPRGRTTVAEPSPSATISSTPTPDPTVTSSQTPIAEAPRTEVVVTLAAMPGRRGWVSVSTPAGEVYQGILENGQTKTFRDKKRLDLVIGDAGAIALTVNGTDLGVSGGSGKIANLTFGPNDPEGATG